MTVQGWLAGIIVVPPSRRVRRGIAPHWVIPIAQALASALPH